MSVNDHLFVHPLLGSDDAWSGYLVESAPGAMTSEACTQLCQHPALKEFDQRHPWLLPALSEHSPCCTLENSVHIFHETDSAEARKLEEELRQARRKLGLVAPKGNKLPMTGTWDYLLIETSQARTLPPYSLLGLSSRTILVATNVHSHADHKWVQANACSLVSTEFLLARHHGDKKADVTRVKLLELLALLAEDADTDAIEAIFRQEPKLSYSLLRLVNSAAIAPRSPITSFGQAINLLGRRQLQRWLQLLVYADPNNGNTPNPLLQKAAARGRLLELLSEHLPAEPEVDNLQDAAFMVGAFSLLDTLLNMSMRDILKQLPLAAPVHAALSEHEGVMGKILQAIKTAEHRDLKPAAEQLANAPFSSAAFLDAQLYALSWASKIRPVS
jgi:EAL and modified HD-GYP domain-containing signal transduction protein